MLRHDPRWRLKMVINGVGAVLTAVVALVFAVTKFHEGAWIILIVIPTLVVCSSPSTPLPRAGGAGLSLDDYGAPPRVLRHRVILPISGVHRGTVAALRYALRPVRTTSRPSTCRWTADKAQPGRGQVGAVGQRRAAGDPRVALPAAPGAAARLHQGRSPTCASPTRRSRSSCRSSCRGSGGTSSCTRRRR